MNVCTCLYEQRSFNDAAGLLKDVKFYGDIKVDICTINKEELLETNRTRPKYSIRYITSGINIEIKSASVVRRISLRELVIKKKLQQYIICVS